MFLAVPAVCAAVLALVAASAFAQPEMGRARPACTITGTMAVQETA